MFEKPPEIKKPLEKKEQEPTNIIEMETANAQYRIYYDSHQSIVDPKLLDGCDGLVMEMVADNSDTQKAQKTFGKIAYAREFTELFQAAAKDKKPIYFVDMQGSGKGLAEEINRLKGKIVAESVAAGGLLAYALGSLGKNEKMNRRDFLKLGAKTTAAAFLSTPIAQELAFAASLDKNKEVPIEGSASRKAEKFLGQINETIHPELATIVVDARNDLIAQKTETAARLFQRAVGKNPKFALIIGAQHSGIERTLKDSEFSRVSRLKKSLSTRLVQNASIAKIEFIQGAKTDEVYYDAKIIKDTALE